MTNRVNRWSLLLVGTLSLTLAGCSATGLDLLWQLILSAALGGLLPSSNVGIFAG